MDKLYIFHDRLKKIGIEIQFAANFPWIYLEKINGIKVIETYESEHNFTVAFLPVNINRPFNFTNLEKTFKLIRKYINKK